MSLVPRTALIPGMVDALSPDRRRFVRTIAVTLVGCVLILAGCSPPIAVQTLEVRPSGVYAQVLTFTATATAKGPEHVLQVLVDIDPAKLMGWAKTNRAYTAGLSAKLVGPKGEPRHSTLYIPITDQQEVGREGNTVQVAFLPAGRALENGFKRGEPKEAFRVEPVPGTYTLTIEMRTVNNADQRMIKAIRNVRLEVLGPSDPAKALANWALVAAPAKAP